MAGYTVLDSTTVLAGTGLCWRDDKIEAVLGNEELRALSGVDEIFDCRDSIIIPGFIDGHVHLYGMLAHGLLPQKPLPDFHEFLRTHWWPDVENRLHAQDITAAARVSCVEHIKSGVTTICDVVEAPNAGPGILEQEAAVVKELGLRGVFSTEASERLGEDRAAKLLAENVAFARSHTGDASIRGMMSIHTTFTGRPDFLRRATALAREFNLDFHMHLSESDYEAEICEQEHGLRPTELYERLGILGPYVVASQGVSLLPRELAILRRYGCRLVHMPLSNCEVGGGFAPVPAMLAAGIRVGLGTDGYVNDFFEVMRGAFLIHKAVAKNSAVMPAQIVFSMATALGAEVLGFSDLGQLRPGFRADFVVLDDWFPTPLTPGNFFDQLVAFGRSEYVRDVYVAGRAIMRERQILHAEENMLRRSLRERSLNFWSSAARRQNGTGQ